MKIRIVSHGITLVEVMVTLAVLGIILALAAPSLADILNRRRVQAIADQINADISYTRAETALRQQDVTLWFQSTESMSCYTVAYVSGGGRCTCADRPGNPCFGAGTREVKTSRVPKSIGVSFSPTAAPAEGTNWTTFNFNRPRMTADPANFAVLVSGVRGAQLQIQINAMGRVKVCSPNGSMPGAPVSCN